MIGETSQNEELLKLHISMVVPLMVRGIIESGGLTDAHIKEAQKHAETVATKGDLILYRGKRRGESAGVIHALCYCLAVGAFIPGGITFMGICFLAPDAGQGK